MAFKYFDPCTVKSKYLDPSTVWQIYITSRAAGQPSPVSHPIPAQCCCCTTLSLISWYLDDPNKCQNNNLLLYNNFQLVEYFLYQNPQLVSGGSQFRILIRYKYDTFLQILKNHIWVGTFEQILPPESGIAHWEVTAHWALCSMSGCLRTTLKQKWFCKVDRIQGSRVLYQN